MKSVETFARLGLKNEDEAFAYLMDNLRDALRQWDYFVNWDKVYRNTRALEVDLNIWNYLLGKENFDTEFRVLLSEHPSITRAIPSLIVRDGAGSTQFSIVADTADWRNGLEIFDFSAPADSELAIEKALTFVKETGLQRIFNSDGVKNLVDFVLGVEAGIDSNGRKNRGGTAMEALVGAYIKDLCQEFNFVYKEQATPAEIQLAWGVEIATGHSARRFDFAVYGNGKLIVLEVNAYGGGGSKLKATAGEFVGLQKQLRGTQATLVWITDGLGWKTSRLPLKQAFSEIDHVFNLKMMTEGALRDVLGV
jgi:type II restriction enzyme